VRVEKEIVHAKDQLGAYQQQKFLFHFPALSKEEPTTLRSELMPSRSMPRCSKPTIASLTAEQRGTAAATPRAAGAFPITSA
jgi:hypothetical protein